MADYIRTLLEGTSDDQQVAIKALTEARLKLKLGGVDYIPSELEYIVTEVSVARFNRIGSEGLASHNVGDETMSWSDDDFAPYESDILAYKNRGGSNGLLKFL